MSKFAIYGVVGLILILTGLTGIALCPAQTGSSNSSPNNQVAMPKYVILKVSDDDSSPVVGHGQIASRNVFDEFFKSNYAIFGTRWVPASDSEIVGLLVVFDAEITVTLPIYGSKEENGSKRFLCRGTSHDGLPPMYLARSHSLQELFKKIKTDLANKDLGKERMGWPRNGQEKGARSQKQN